MGISIILAICVHMHNMETLLRFSMKSNILVLGQWPQVFTSLQINKFIFQDLIITDNWVSNSLLLGESQWHANFSLFIAKVKKGNIFTYKWCVSNKNLQEKNTRMNFTKKISLETNVKLISCRSAFKMIL